MSKIITIRIEEHEAEKPKIVKNADGSYKNVSDYARFFNSSCVAWDANSEYNLLFLRQQQMYATQRLRAEGYLFLNDVYDMLGMTRSKRGAVVGWVYDEQNPVGDNYVDFGLFEDYNKEFINGTINSVLIDFNVDGCILDKLSDY